MQNNVIIARVLSVSFRNCSLYGNPSYYVSFENVANGEYFRGHTAPNSASGYGCRNFENGTAEIEYHEGAHGVIIDYMRKTPEAWDHFHRVLKKNLPFAGRGAWGRGLKYYADHLIKCMAEYIECGENNGSPVKLPENLAELEALALNGASGWIHYSEGGNALIYDRDIVELLAPASVLKKYDSPRGWVPRDGSAHRMQGRALAQAFGLVFESFKTAKEAGEL